MGIRHIISSSVKATAAGFACGAIIFFLEVSRKQKKLLPFPEPETEEEKEKLEEELQLAMMQAQKDKLVREVHVLTFCRQVVAQAEPIISNLEFEKRRRLEEMGYFPCPKCGIAHLQGEEAKDCMPPGTYFSKLLERHIGPEHPDWKKEEYEAATGEKWEAPEDDDTVH